MKKRVTKTLTKPGLPSLFKDDASLKEIPENIKADLEIIPVKWIDEVLDHALAYSPDSDQHKEKLAENAKKTSLEAAEGSPERINTH